MVVDSSRKESRADLNLIERFKSKKMILLFSKADLPRRVDRRRCLAPVRKNALARDIRPDWEKPGGAAGGDL